MNIPPLLTGWLATYALHSTILLGLVLLVSSRVRSDAWRETLWKTALLGGLLTATLQSAAGYTPLVGRWVLQEESAAASIQTVGEQERESETTSPDRGKGLQPQLARQTGAGVPLDPPLDSAMPSLPPPDGAAADGGIPWIPLLVGFWLTGAALLLGRLAVQHVWLFRVLADRRPITEGPLSGMLASLRRYTGMWSPVRLTLSSACPSPLALGRSEICVPERFLSDLEPEQQRSALAHELAHLRRWDPIWQLTAGIIESVFFFQPLNRVARWRLRDAAENLCDDWAVRHTGSALGLARCLTDIAAWVSPTAIPDTTLAMAEGGSPLLRRVQRLTEWKEPSMYAAQLRPIAPLVLLTLVLFIAPAVSQRSSSPDSPGVEVPLSAREASTVSDRPRTRAVVTDSVVLHPAPSAPLADRWSWALSQDLRGGFWIAWGVDGSIRPNRSTVITNGHIVLSREGVLSSNSSGPGAYTTTAPPLHALLPRSAEVPSVGFVFGFADESDRAEEMDWIRIRSADAPLDLAGRPLLWLGDASTEESLALLLRLYERLDEPALRMEIAAALSVHMGEPQVLRAVQQLISSEESAAVRAEAIQWLPRGQEGGPELVAFLRRTAENDPSPRVRNEAVDALATLESSRARDALLHLALSAPFRDVRKEAVDGLQHDANALARIIRSDSDAGTRSEAVEALAGHPGDDTIKLLLSLVYEDPARSVQEEAIDQLDAVGSSEARSALERIVDTHSSAAIRAEAAEVLARGGE